MNREEKNKISYFKNGDILFSHFKEGKREGQARGFFKTGEIKDAYFVNDKSIRKYEIDDKVYHEIIHDLVIPSTITNIGEYAFAVTSLTNVVIPNSVKTIGKCAFYKVSTLKKVTLSNSLESIGDWVFNHCDLLTAIYIDGEHTANSVWASTLSTKWLPSKLDIIYIDNSVPEANVGAGIKEWGDRDPSEDITGYYAYYEGY